MNSRPETADKLKPVLVQVNAPAAGTPFDPPSWGETATLTFHFIAPESQGDITAGSTAAEPAPLTFPIGPLAVNPPTVTTYAGLKHVVVTASVAIPSAAEWALISPALAEAPFIRLRYRLLVNDGIREIPIVGDFPAYRTDDVPGAAATLSGSRIVTPTSGSQVGGELDVEAQIVNTQQEPVKLGWYASAGEIENRRAATSTWKLPGPGRYTLVFTVRGKTSRSGEIAFSEVQVP
jgi:hypothetical protein